ncbi:class F sortase [Arthrobacter sp.]|uniref:class F sortase n=1 Tax=Arthrobacter sp. TaxID=1667 RepID=UPI00281228CC|nr:class F sortase [Arthrobacter sp.]
MISFNSGRRRNFAVSAAAALLVLTGCGSTDTGPSAQAPTTTTTAPTASASAPASASPTPAASTTPTAETAPELPAVLEASEPVSFSIPVIGAGSDLLSLGLRENGSLEVPPDGPGAPASWYNQSPTPGERGPSVLLGHVNATDGGPGVFADLRSLKAGDLIEVVRADGSTATFEMVRGEQYPKDDFPTETVYGNTAGAELRLITCDGYDPATGLFDDNYVIFAQLVL